MAGNTWRRTWGEAGIIGAYAFMGPKAGRDTFNVSGETADLTFGAVTVGTGIVGTVAGGLLLDYVGSTMRNALLICGVCVLTGYWPSCLILPMLPILVMPASLVLQTGHGSPVSCLYPTRTDHDVGQNGETGMHACCALTTCRPPNGSGCSVASRLTWGCLCLFRGETGGRQAGREDGWECGKDG